MTLLITKVGAPQMHTHELKDGSGNFSKTEVPVTLQAKFGEEAGFVLGVNYTMWLDPIRASKVIGIASALIDGTATDGNGELYHPVCRLALKNLAECFDMGPIRTKELPSKFGGTYTVTNQTIWLKDELVCDWTIGELAISPERGNIDDLDVLVDFRGASLIVAPVVTSTATAEVPF